MKTIWKYKLEGKPLQTIAMPVGAQILSAAAQGDDICVWAVVTPQTLTENRRFVICGTGHELHEGALKHIGTCVFHDGRYVFHVFEKE